MRRKGSPTTERRLLSFIALSSVRLVSPCSAIMHNFSARVTFRRRSSNSSSRHIAIGIIRGICGDYVRTIVNIRDRVSRFRKIAWKKNPARSCDRDNLV